MRVSAVQEATPEVVSAVQRLVPQLSSMARPPDAAEVAELVASQAATLLVARDDEAMERVSEPTAHAENPHGPIVGMLTLVTFRIPTGVRAWVQDVVVEGVARGRGVGEALTVAALQMAGAGGARTVDLTTRASREAANQLYHKMGFQLRDTNVYRYSLHEEGDPPR
ncbi:MAG: GNAT family N-acetyltransferase [Acidimicrobiales bacterium]